MDIIKAFEYNDMHQHITVQGTHEEPLFRASDVAAVLEMTNIRVMIKDFDNTEKDVRIAYTPGGPQEVTFLTEKGLYQVLFTSRKPIAKQFKNWVCQVIKEIRLNGKYELEKQITEATYQLQLKDTEKDKLLEKTLIDKHPINTPCIYIGTIDNLSDNGEKLLKFGETYTLEARIKQHKNDYNNFKLRNVFKAVNSKKIESMIKIDAYLKPMLRSIIDVKNNKRVELIAYTDSIIDTIERRIMKIIKDNELTMEDLKNENNLLKNILKQNNIDVEKYGLDPEPDPEKLIIKPEPKHKICPECNGNMSKDSKTCSNCYTKSDKRGLGNAVNKKEDKKCADCDKIIKRRSIRCPSCASKHKPNRKVEDRPSLQQIENDLKELKTYAAVARKYEVSSTAIKKWIKSYKSENKNGQ